MRSGGLKGKFCGDPIFAGALLFTFCWMGKGRDPDSFYHIGAYNSASHYL